MRFYNAFDYFVPLNARADEWNYRRQRAFVGVCLISALYALIYIPQVILEEYYGALTVIVVFAFVCTLLPFLLRNQVPLWVLTNIYLANMAISEARILFISGGVLNTATDPQILAVLPMMALLFLNLRAAFIWFFIGVAIIVLFGVLEVNGFDFKIEMNPRYIKFQTISAAAGHLLIIFMVINIFEGQKNRALKRLEEKNTIIEKERKRSDELLLNILPEDVMNELKETGKTTARNYDLVTVMFVDFKDFTLISNDLTPEELVSGIDDYFETFDRIVEKHRIEKIKTIGDAYLCAAGIPIPNTKNPIEMVDVAFLFLEAARNLKEQRMAKEKPVFDLRIGIHSGPLIAGVVGIKKFAFDIWGDAVNTAARMQQHGEEGKINISGTTYELIKHRFRCTHRGRIEAKHKGLIDMYFVEGRR